MPYIKQEDREKFSEGLESLFGTIETPGDLNYVITSIADEFIKRKGLKYQNLNDVVGALECAKMELYRRVAAPYEDIKIEENGDAYSDEIKS